jgi:hypothetical protein
MGFAFSCVEMDGFNDVFFSFRTAYVYTRKAKLGIVQCKDLGLRPTLYRPNMM